jgi:hypothetical protein
MQFRFALSISFALALGAFAFTAPALAEDCSQGSADAKIACLTTALAALETRVGELNRRLDAKADKGETLKWLDRIALVNEDMRIFARCLDNPGPNSRDIAAVLAASCAKTASQSWMIVKPYHAVPGGGAPKDGTPAQ